MLTRCTFAQYRVEEALAAASEHGELAAFEHCSGPAVRRACRLGQVRRTAPREVTARYGTFCGT
jgi:hypothetical protein